MSRETGNKRDAFPGYGPAHGKDVDSRVIFKRSQRNIPVEDLPIRAMRISDDQSAQRQADRLGNHAVEKLCKNVIWKFFLLLSRTYFRLSSFGLNHLSCLHRSVLSLVGNKFPRISPEININLFVCIGMQVTPVSLNFYSLDVMSS